MDIFEKVLPVGIEPRTLRLLAVRSNQLSYVSSCLTESGSRALLQGWPRAKTGALEWMCVFLVGLESQAKTYPACSKCHHTVHDFDSVEMLEVSNGGR